MEALSISIGSLIILVGGVIGVLTYFRTRDKDKSQKAEEMAKLKADVQMLKDELHEVKTDIVNRDDKLTEKLNTIDRKIDRFLERVIELANRS